MAKRKVMITKELAKRLIEQAEFNCSGENVAHNIDNIKELSEEGAYLVFASSVYSKTSFVCYEDGTAFFLKDWQSDYPKNENEIEWYDWVTIEWKESPFCIYGLPRILVNG